MEKKDKIFLILFFILILLSIVFTFYRYVILRDFSIYTNEEEFNQSLLEE